MLKWTANRSKASALATSVVSYGDVIAPDDAPAFWTHPLLDRATAWLGKLHSHLTILQPGGGYAPHRDEHEVAIVLLSGTVETLGKRVTPLSVIYYSAGELHGMKNVGDEPARYLVFEFHPHDSRPVRRLLQAVARSAKGRAKDLARPIWRRIKRRRG